jgi:hypothetical protein
MVESRRPKPVIVHALMGALMFQALGAVGGGLALIADPTGASMGMSVDALGGSPFGDYMIPGLVLLTLMGLGPVAAVYGLWTGRPWSRHAALAVGVALIVWIGVQVWILGYHPRPPLQLIFGALGAVIVVLTVLAPATP